MRETQAMAAALAERACPGHQPDRVLTARRSRRRVACWQHVPISGGALAYSPIGQGRLTGKYNAHNRPQGRRNFSDHPMEVVDDVVAA
ncbi:MAG: hypothetical protein IPG97_07065 [Microthrixaceae bacterium]|nr:hypothetical protein [Microthrixaceae bacterium]